jgi:hypothetical protein
VLAQLLPEVNTGNSTASILRTSAAVQDGERSIFFRQGAWMVLAAVLSGSVNSLVHIFSKFIPPAEYASLGILLQIFNWMTIPALGLQLLFAYRSAAAITTQRKRELAGAVRAATLAGGLAWVFLALAAYLARHQLTNALKLTNPPAFWLTVAIAFFMFLSPVFAGVMQGQQNFCWLGWAALFNSFSRLLISALLVLYAASGAAGVMAGAFAGTGIALGLTVWQTSEVWQHPADQFRWGSWFAGFVPITVAFGVSQFLLGADLLYVQAYLGADGNAAPYVFGGALARAMVIAIGPLAAVMFPKIVRSEVCARNTNVLGWAFFGTVILSAGAATVLSLAAPLLISWGSRPENLSFAPLMPLFAWGMVPLAVGNVLLNSLLARSRFELLPALVLVAVGYGIALGYHHDSFTAVLQTLGVFNLAFLGVCLFYSWWAERKQITCSAAEGQR